MKLIITIFALTLLNACAFKDHHLNTKTISTFENRNQKNKTNTIQLEYRNGMKSSSGLERNNEKLQNSKILIWDPTINGDSLDIALNSNLISFQKPSLIRANMHLDNDDSNHDLNISMTNQVSNNNTEIKLHLQNLPFEKFLGQWNRDLNIDISFHKNSNEKLFTINLSLKTPNEPLIANLDSRYQTSIDTFHSNIIKNLRPLDVYKIKNTTSENKIFEIKTKLQGKVVMQLETSSYLENIKTVSQNNIGKDWNYNDCEPTQQKNNYLIAQNSEFLLIPLDAESEEANRLYQNLNIQTYELEPNETKEFILYAIQSDTLQETNSLGVCNSELKKIATRCQRMQCIGGYAPPQECFHDDSFYCGTPWNTADRNDSRFCTQWNLEASQFEFLPSQTNRLGQGYQISDADSIIKVTSELLINDEYELTDRVYFNNKMQSATMGAIDFNLSVSNTYPLSCGF